MCCTTPNQIPEELTLDYAEITSIPPLPLWTLLAADKESTSSNLQQNDEVKVSSSAKNYVAKLSNPMHGFQCVGLQ